MKHSITKYLLTAFVAVLAAGCTEERFMEYRPEADTPVNVHMALSVAPMAGNVIETRSALVDEATQEDNEIHNLWVLQFRGTTAADSLREARYYSSYDPAQMFKLIASSVPNRVVIVANTFDSLIAFSHCADMAEFIESYRSVSKERDLDSIVAGKHCPLMSAYQDVTLNEAGITLGFDLKRTVCKVDVNITNTTKETEAVDVDIKKVTVCSVVSKSFFFNSYTLPDRYPAKYNGDRIDYPAMDWTDGTVGGSAEQRSFTFYLPVNKSGTVAAVPHNPQMRGAYAPDGATYLCIQGTYDDPADPSIKRPVEYRVMLGDSDTDFNLLPNCKYSYNVTIDDMSDAGTDSRQVEQALVDFCSWEHANSYIINPSTVEGTWKNYRIPVAKCYDFWNPIDGLYSNADNALMLGGYGWKVEVIWSEQPITYDTNFKWIKDEGTDYRDYFEFSLPYGFEHGNIVIGIRRYIDAGRTQLTDEFIWSWQMWVTDYDPYPALKFTPQVDGEGNELQFAYSVKNGDVHRYNFTAWKTGIYKDSYIMDRNMGALSTSAYKARTKGFLFYVFGRKDPFRSFQQTIYSGPQGLTYGVIGKGSTGMSDNVIYSIYHPNKYINGIGLWGNSFWQKNSVYEQTSGFYWGDPRNIYETGKSVFDPCPPGWRVPTSAAFNNSFGGLTAASGYYYFNLTKDVRVILPTGGSLLCDRNGIEQLQATFMYFANPSGSYALAAGYSTFSLSCGHYVRCVTDKPFD